MIYMLRKGIKFSIQRVYFPQSYFESRHYGKRFNSIGKFKSLTFQLCAIYFHTFAVDMSVVYNNTHILCLTFLPSHLICNNDKLDMRMYVSRYFTEYVMSTL